MIRKLFHALVFPSLVIAVTAQFSRADWPTFAHDPQRSGYAFEESSLDVHNVGQMELKWRVQLKNAPKSLTALTAPVVAEGVDTARGRKTVVYVAGSGNNIYALDAADGSTLWSREFESHSLPKDEGMWLCPNGLNATPTIDRRRNLIYAIAVDGSLWGLDLGNGEPRFGPVQFVPPFSKNWSLNLADGIIYTSISQGCGGAESGIYAMDIRDPMHPSSRALYIARHSGAGIWGRGGTTIGTNGRIYGEAGDGDFDPAQDEYANSIIAAKLPDLTLVDYYVPTNYRDVSKFDLDMGAAGPVWLSVGDFDLLAAGGKEGVVYLLNADELGARDHQTPLYYQQIANDGKEFEGKGIWGALATWRDDQEQTWVYVPVLGPLSKKAPHFPVANGPTPHGCIAAFRVVTDRATRKPTMEPVWLSGDFDVPEPPVIANGVVFGLSTGENTIQVNGPGVIAEGYKLLTDAQRSQQTHNAALYALDAKTGKTLYQSGNIMTTWVHFSGLAIADGRVYAVDHDSHLYCFGLKKEKPKRKGP